MNWNNVKLILMREVRDQVRDRRTLFMIAVLPMLLYPLLGMSFFQIAQFTGEQPTSVLVLGAEELGPLEDLPALIEGDRFASELFSPPSQVDLLELEVLPPAEPPNSQSESAATARLALLEESFERVQQGEYQVLVEFPLGFGEELLEFRRRLLGRREADSQFRGDEDRELPGPVIYTNTASQKSQIAYSRVADVLDKWSEQIGRRNLQDSRVPLVAAKPFRFEHEDVAADGHRDAAMWSKVLPFVLLIWALTGAFYPAIDLCAGEKERGTLETLLSSPAERRDIVWGKLLTVMLFSICTAVLNLLSMGMTGSLLIAQLNRMNVLAAGQLSAPPLSSAFWLLLALLPISALFAALCLALAAFARSTKEGQYYLMPLLLVTMPLMILPMAPGVELTLGNSLIPVTGVVLWLKTMLEGNYMQGLVYAAPVAGVTSICGLLAIRWAVDQFNRETVLFRESERLDLRLWLQHLLRDRAPTPSLGEAIFCFVLILLVQFFIRTALPHPVDLRSIVQTIFISQVVVIALPALLMTIMLTSEPRRTLLLADVPSWRAIAIGLLLAITLHPVVQCVTIGVQHLYPISPEVAAASAQLVDQIFGSPYPWLPYLLLAVLPACCEEFAFRGFLLSGLRHIGHKWWAIGLSAIFFGMAHTLLQQSVSAALVGVAIGYLAVQTGHLVPCMVFHITHNCLGLASSRWHIRPATFADYPELAYLFETAAEGEQTVLVYRWPLVAAGALLATVLFTWLARLPYRKTREEQLQEALDHQSDWTPLTPQCAELPEIKVQPTGE